MNDKTGGPAFPVSDVMALEPRTTAEMISLAHGMTLRDYFAAKAMQGMMAYGQCNSMEAGPIAAFAYEYADAMLLERAK